MPAPHPQAARGAAGGWAGTGTPPLPSRRLAFAAGPVQGLSEHRTTRRSIRTKPVPTPAAPRHAPTDGCGFIFAATGVKYTVLSQRAARNLRQVMPGWPIDLFTDQDVQDPVFARIHGLNHKGPRPKIEAMQRSRFERTVYLDSDIIPLADIGDIFQLLEQAEFAATHVQYRTCPPGGNDPDLPAAFPQVNGGLIGLRATPATRQLLQDWQAAMDKTSVPIDQVSLRRLLYHGNVRLAVLPPEYNFIRLVWLEAWDWTMGAPRLLHLGHVKQGDPGDPETPQDVAAVIGARYAAHLQRLIAADPSLGGDRAARVEALVRQQGPLRALGRRLLRRLKPARR
jgi:hypothetical protein